MILITMIFSLVTFSSFAKSDVMTLRQAVFEGITQDLKKKYKTNWVLRADHIKKVPKKKSKKVSKSEGQRKVEAMLARNRAQIKNKKSPQEELDWYKQKGQELSNWYNSRAAILKRWGRAKLRYKKKIPAYKKALAPLPIKEKKIPKLVGLKPEGSYLMKGPFVRASVNQGKRSTCAAFAAAKAIEIKLAQKNKGAVNLSEQYLYWASKPKCQKSPCTRKGSWPLHALKKSKRSRRADIPLEKSCPYSSKNQLGNETQVPLYSKCRQGRHKVVDYREVESMKEIDQALKEGHPVIGGFKLDDAFYKNNGNIYFDPQASVSTRKHADGHAILIIGKIPYPAAVPSHQGGYCYLVSNSWGEGWGKGGYACIAQKWIETKRYQIPFIAVTKVL